MRLAPALLLGLVAGIAPAKAGVGGSSEKAEETRSLLGNYLAGRVARGLNDTEAAAAYYGRALTRDPGNEVLTEFAFLMEATEGNWSRVEMLARDLLRVQANHRTAHAFLGVASFKAGDYQAADEHFKLASANPIGELTSTLARAWVYQAQGKTTEALALLESPRQPDWAQYYLRYHKALLADQAGRRTEARAAFERIPKNDQRTLRISLAFARHAANAGDPKLAQSILKAHFERSKADGHPMARTLETQIDAGQRPELLISTPAQGLAEVFYGLGEALTGKAAPASAPSTCSLPSTSFRTSLRAGDACQRLRDDQALRQRHCRLRPHTERHAAAVEHRHSQGAEPQPARAHR
jgi:tetratricopeptide (TPR) repeat protein